MRIVDQLLYVLVGLIGVVVIAGTIRGSIDVQTVTILAGFGGVLVGVLDRKSKGDGNGGGEG